MVESVVHPAFKVTISWPVVGLSLILVTLIALVVVVLVKMKK